jgi:hypothetical protein
MTVWEWMYSSTILYSALDVGEWSAPRTDRFTPGERAHGTHRIGFWVDPSAGLDAVQMRKVSYPCRESNSGRTMTVRIQLNKKISGRESQGA